MRKFYLFINPPRSKWTSSEKMFFFFFSKSASSLNEAKTHWMANWLQLLYTKVFMKNSSQWFRRHIQLLSTMVDGTSRTFSGTAAKFSGVPTVFGFSRFGLSIDKDVSFFRFFHMKTNIWSSECFSSSKIRTQFSHTFCNITMIFKVMSQYLPPLFKRRHNHIPLAEG